MCIYAYICVFVYILYLEYRNSIAPLSMKILLATMAYIYAPCTSVLSLASVGRTRTLLTCKILYIFSVIKIRPTREMPQCWIHIRWHFGSHFVCRVSCCRYRWWAHATGCRGRGRCEDEVSAEVIENGSRLGSVWFWSAVAILSQAAIHRRAEVTA